MPGMAGSLEPHGIPLGLRIADEDKFMRVAYELQPMIILPPGTVIEMVGEMVFRPGTAMLTPSNFDYFIVHGIPEAQDLVLPFSSSLTELSILGPSPNANLNSGRSQPFLTAIDAPSQWTCHRFEGVEGAVQRWATKYKSYSFRLSQRFKSPTCSSS
jgi:hypothetical protein